MKNVIKNIEKRIAAIEKQQDIVQRELWKSDYKNIAASIKQGELSKERSEMIGMLESAKELQKNLVKQGIIKE